MSQDVERWKRDLEDAGWTAASATAWWDPSGGLYRGPYGAWKELQRRNGVLIATDADAARAREVIGNVNNYAEDDGELSISAFGPLSARIAEALATVRAEVWNETFRIQCVDCAEGDEPIYCKQARWFYHGISNQEVGCSASKLRIAALESAENRKGEG